MTERRGAVALISGGGTNLQALLDASRSGDLALDFRAVISNRPGVRGLQRARDAGVPAITLDHQQYSDRPEFERALALRIDDHSPDLVILAGFMRILTAGFVDRYLGRMLNIHPSLLPSFRGLHTHERALAAGVKQHGASVHFVTAELDGGPVILQATVDVHEDDDADRLAARVLEQEHVIYPLAAAWFADGRLELRDNRAWLDNAPLHHPRLVQAGKLVDGDRWRP